jgi:hypothetical protein
VIQNIQGAWRISTLSSNTQYSGEKHRHLYQDRQASTQRVDLLFFVQLHHRLGHLLAIIAKLFFQGLQSSAPPRACAPSIDSWQPTAGRKPALINDGQEDDRPAPVTQRVLWIFCSSQKIG